jgi:SAM-dependent methyltransferase
VIGIVSAVLLIAGLLVNGLRLRGRLAALPALPSEEASTPDGAESGHRAVVAEGMTLDETTLRTATAFASHEGLDIVDLIPGDLPVTAARDLAGHATPPDANGHRNGLGAGVAVLVASSVLDRAQITDPGAPATADLIGFGQRVKNYAPDRTALVVAPGLRAASDDLRRRPARMRAAGAIPPIALVFALIPYVLLAEALAGAPVWGAMALAALCLQPYLIFAGTGLRPRGLHAAALLRPVYDAYVWVRTATGRWRSAAEQRADALRAEGRGYYQEELALGVDRFFEPRHDTCPWCGSGALSRRLRSSELVYHKPGTFVLERCDGCGHIFQNPRLTPAGLDFYYRDFYDGIGAANSERVFSGPGDEHVARAKMPEPFLTPKTWLDVGSGHAHFCATARRVWPDTVFDGLDQGAEIEEAARRGWIANAYRGSFPDLGAEIQDRYDVISMHHYLEHTRDPLAELDVVAKVLPPGGHVLIELPDPEWGLSRLFGQYWMPWFQPQHQHMMPIGNLKNALAERGLEPVAEDRAAAHQYNDFMGATYLFVAGLAPDRTLPWSTKRRTALHRVRHGVVWAFGIPALLAAVLLDKTLTGLIARRTGRGNAYRVLARKEGSDG